MKLSALASVRGRRDSSAAAGGVPHDHFQPRRTYPCAERGGVCLHREPYQQTGAGRIRS